MPIVSELPRIKIKEDEQWDGLKGYLTNTELSPQEVYHQYSCFWSIERAFRITKGTIEVRPMFHFTERRIEAHVCICFVAYKVYKELERILKINLPISGQTVNKTMFFTESHKEIVFLFDDDFWENHLG
ncbi:IS1634 family transposase [Maribacter litoralis]|uniref:IS1634 family transposase n=1 Tax=Maribacter litoralis TaxID=2059726 RepID=UPI003F5CF595